MAEYMKKDAFLDTMRSGYTAFEDLLNGLDSTQMTTPGVSGAWSVKDHIAHLSFWMDEVLRYLRKHREGVDYDDPLVGLSTDEGNERVYQQNKDRSLDDIRNEFRSVSQQYIHYAEKLSEEELNGPVSKDDPKPLWKGIAGDGYEHYAEHADYIREYFNKEG